MEATLSCQVTVVDENDLPIPGANVGFSPNQYTFEGGSRLLGAESDSLKYLRAPRGAAAARRGCRRRAWGWVESGVAINPEATTRRSYGTELILEGVAGAFDRIGDTRFAGESESLISHEKRVGPDRRAAS